MSKTALRINTDGTHEWLDLASYELGLLQDAVGGYIENVWLQPLGLLMVINDSGKVADLDGNAFGTRLWGAVYGATDYIVGNIVLLGARVAGDGETTGLSPHQSGALAQALLLVEGGKTIEPVLVELRESQRYRR